MAQVAPIILAMQPLPYRHLYHSEIHGGGLGVFHRMMRFFRKAKPQLVVRNWHYNNVDMVGSYSIFLCKNVDGKQYSVSAYCPPGHPPLQVRHV